MTILDSAQQAEGVDISASQADGGEVDSQSLSTPDVETLDVKALQERLAQAEKRIAKAEHEASKARRQAAARRVEAKKSPDGDDDDGKPVASTIPDELRAKLDRFDKLEKVLARQQAAERAQVRAIKKQVEEKASALPSYLQAIIKDLPPKSALALIEQHGKRTRADTAAPSRVAGDGTASATFAELRKSMSAEEIATKHPEIYRAAIAKTRTAKTTSIGRLLGRY